HRPVRFSRIEQRQNVRMLQIGRGLDLGEEAVRSNDRGQFGAEYLQGNLPIVPHIVGEIDGGHAALAQLPLDAVAVGEGGRESVVGSQWVRCLNSSNAW